MTTTTTMHSERVAITHTFVIWFDADDETFRVVRSCGLPALRVSRITVRLYREDHTVADASRTSPLDPAWRIAVTAFGPVETRPADGTMSHTWNLNTTFVAVPHDVLRTIGESSIPHDYLVGRVIDHDGCAL